MKPKETEKYTQIMSVAAALFARQGYQKTTINEIVATAGISKGLFYHYFENKKELYLLLYETYTDVLSHDIREKVDVSETDFFNRLRQICHLRIDFVTRMPHLWDFLYSAYNEEHTDIAPLIQNKNAQILQESYSSSVSNIDWTKLQPGLNPDKAIELITWAAEGFIRKVTAKGIHVKSETYMEFDGYLEYLKSGMYKEEV